MIWATWRQHRQQMIAGFGALTAIAVFLLINGHQMHATYDRSGLATCLTSATQGCRDVMEAFRSKYQSFFFLLPLFLAAPALAGMFWGAPLIARETEAGTHRFAWTQGISRRRWLTWKVGIFGVSTVIVGAAIALLVSWWSRLFLSIGDNGRFDPGWFDLRGIVPIAYILFALALGVAFGQLFGKTLPAIGATLGGFVAVRVLVDLLLRKHYMGAKTVSSLLVLGPDKGSRVLPHGSPWILGEKIVDAAGHTVSSGPGLDFNYLTAHCPGFSPNTPTGPDKAAACVQHLGLRVVDVFQPGSRYWTFQWIESAIFVALAIALVAFVFWQIRRTA